MKMENKQTKKRTENIKRIIDKNIDVFIRLKDK